MTMKSISFVQPQWLQAVLNSYVVDPKAQELLIELAVMGTNAQGFSLRDGLIRQHTKVWVGANVAHQTKLIHAFHSTPIGGHSGRQATYQRLKKLFC